MSGSIGYLESLARVPSGMHDGGNTSVDHPSGTPYRLAFLLGAGPSLFSA